MFHSKRSGFPITTFAPLCVAIGLMLPAHAAAYSEAHLSGFEIGLGSTVEPSPWIALLAGGAVLLASARRRGR